MVVPFILVDKIWLNNRRDKVRQGRVKGNLKEFRGLKKMEISTGEGKKNGRYSRSLNSETSSCKARKTPPKGQKIRYMSWLLYSFSQKEASQRVQQKQILCVLHSFNSLLWGFTAYLKEDPSKILRHKPILVPNTENKNNMIATFPTKLHVHTGPAREWVCTSELYKHPVNKEVNNAYGH